MVARLHPGGRNANHGRNANRNSRCDQAWSFCKKVGDWVALAWVKRETGATVAAGFAALQVCRYLRIVDWLRYFDDAANATGEAYEDFQEMVDRVQTRWHEGGVRILVDYRLDLALRHDHVHASALVAVELVFRCEPAPFSRHNAPDFPAAAAGHGGRRPHRLRRWVWRQGPFGSDPRSVPPAGFQRD